MVEEGEVMVLKHLYIKLIACLLGICLGGCKPDSPTEPSADAKPAQNAGSSAPSDVTSSGSTEVVTGQQSAQEPGTVSSSNIPVGEEVNPFQFNPKGIYGMSLKELQRIPPHILQAEVNVLKKRNESEKEEKKVLENYIDALCDLLIEKEKSCLAMKYLVPGNALAGYQCDADYEPAKETLIKVRLLKGDGKFRLLANGLYVSQAFGKGSTTLSFERLDGQVKKSPRLRDLSSLHIVAVGPQSKIIAGSISPRRERPIEVDMRILVDGKDLFKEFKLIPPIDKSNTSEYRISPEELVSLAQAKGCKTTINELNALLEQVK